MKLTRRDAIIKALEARGETRIYNPSLSKFWQYTRTHFIEREPDGSLREFPQVCKPGWSYFYVSRSTGAMRVGRTSTSSSAIAKDMRDIFVKEGRALP